jgi:hypothetical protein
MEKVLNANAGKISVFAALCFLLCGARIEAQLPTGMTVVPFYDTAHVSFVKDSARTVGLWEVPGKPQHFFVLDQRGLIYSLYPDTTLTYAPGAIKKYSKATLANFRNVTKQNLRSEMGAWSMAFHPNFRQNSYVYVCYFRYFDASVNYAITAAANNTRTDGYVVVERWIASANRNALTRDTTVYSFYHQASYGVSAIAFGPDGYLYIGTSVYSQNGWSDTTVARKILRIDVNNRDPGKMHAIPPTNPLYGSTAPNVKKEIYAKGLRNVWSMSFNWQTGALWAGEVGQTGGEEINIIQPGRNYGWANGGNSESSNDGVGVQGPCPTNYSYTGTFSDGQAVTCAQLTNPDWYFPQAGTGPVDQRMNCIVVGPTFRGDSTSPFYGYTFVTDVQRNTFWAVKEGPGGARPAPQVVGGSPNTIAPNTDGHNGIVHIGEDSYGNMYASYVSWYYPGSIGATTNALPGGQRMFHEIYRLSHPQLTPRSTPSPIAAARTRLPKSAGAGLWFPHAGGRRLEIPEGYSGVTLRDLGGRAVWSRRGAPGFVEVPAEVESGILHVGYLR